MVHSHPPDCTPPPVPTRPPPPPPPPRSSSPPPPAHTPYQDADPDVHVWRVCDLLAAAHKHCPQHLTSTNNSRLHWAPVALHGTLPHGHWLREGGGGARGVHIPSGALPKEQPVLVPGLRMHTQCVHSASRPSLAPTKQSSLHLQHRPHKTAHTSSSKYFSRLMRLRFSGRGS